jgi:hypothetical protein
MVGLVPNSPLGMLGFGLRRRHAKIVPQIGDRSIIKIL